MQQVTARVETETKHAASYWTERHGLDVEGQLPVEGDTYEGQTAQVAAEGVRVSVSPEFDGVWIYVRAEGLELRVQVRPESATIEDTLGETVVCVPRRATR